MFDGLEFSPREWFFLPLIALLLSTVTTAGLIRYAHKRQLLDQPGKRRSHQVPTPRGGGLAIVFAGLVSGFLPLYLTKYFVLTSIFAILFGSILVATVGWRDDHHPLSAKLRFIVHVISSYLFALSLDVSSAFIFVVVVLSCTWSINLHNFMDGIDGFLATQAIFVFLGMAFLAGKAGHFPFTLSMLTLAAAVMGFLCFNFPPAKIFMGDVGSGALGFLIAAFIWLGYAHGVITLFEGLIITVTFVVDATCTLLLRMMKGRQWYRPHREHLYQWLVRTGSTHTQVVRWYLIWNLGVVVPLLLLSRRFPHQAFSITVGLYGFTIGCWFFGKFFCLNRPKMIKSSNHATA